MDRSEEPSCLIVQNSLSPSDVSLHCSLGLSFHFSSYTFSSPHTVYVRLYVYFGTKLEWTNEISNRNKRQTDRQTDKQT